MVKKNSTYQIVSKRSFGNTGVKVDTEHCCREQNVY